MCEPSSWRSVLWAYVRLGACPVTVMETNALLRLGFRWPIIYDAYLEKAIWALDTLSFFSDEI